MKSRSSEKSESGRGRFAFFRLPIHTEQFYGYGSDISTLCLELSVSA